VPADPITVAPVPAGETPPGAPAGVEAEVGLGDDGALADAAGVTADEPPGLSRLLAVTRLPAVSSFGAAPVAGTPVEPGAGMVAEAVVLIPGFAGNVPKLLVPTEPVVVIPGFGGNVPRLPGVAEPVVLRPGFAGEIPTLLTVAGTHGIVVGALDGTGAGLVVLPVAGPALVVPDGGG
jgi:hypothetical protein